MSEILIPICCGRAGKGEGEYLKLLPMAIQLISFQNFIILLTF